MTRAAVAVARAGMDKVPGGPIAMKLLNPILDKGLSQVSDWENNVRPIDRMSKAQKKAHGDAYIKKHKPKQKRRDKALRLLSRLNRGSFRGRWGALQEKIMKDGGYSKRKGGYKELSMTAKW